MKTTLGGDRLGSGNKQEISMKNFERSSHDLGYIWRSSMGAGTLVPFMSELALPGDSFDIDLDCDVKTLPTLGPLFGSYKVQLDVFQCPVRLYQGKLHMNMLNIGLDMSEIYLPQFELSGNYKQADDDVNNSEYTNQQVNPSSIYSYLNVRGIGRHEFQGTEGVVQREFNAVPYLGYWDIYKNYYANLQEEDANGKARGYVVHNNSLSNDFSVSNVQPNATLGGGYIVDVLGGTLETIYNTLAIVDTSVTMKVIVYVKWKTLGTSSYGRPDPEKIDFNIDNVSYQAKDVFGQYKLTNWEGGSVGDGEDEYKIEFENYTGTIGNGIKFEMPIQTVKNTEAQGLGQPQLEEFELENIDTMRMNILQAVASPSAFLIDSASQTPYGLGLGDDGEGNYYATSNQEGLGIKTYQSDLFNNWISTEWIDGNNGINAVTSVSVPVSGNEGSFTIDSLNLANKVYNMLNRIAISGGSYDDWLDAVYTHDRAKSCETPIYHGSLIKELAFQEVISNSDTEVNGETQPLGTLAGRGILTGKNKGGKVKIKVDEPSYLIGIVSITPRIDYSQGNKWDMSLKTMNDFHKPSLDEIGFQDRITDDMAWFDTYIDSNGDVKYNSAGKQPAWINYMTNVNVTKGKFAQESEMFMTLNRRYEDNGTHGRIGDITTYVDPSKYNYIFAEQSLDSQNFWVQIKNDIFARRKMSAKVIPNL